MLPGTYFGVWPTLTTPLASPRPEADSFLSSCCPGLAVAEDDIDTPEACQQRCLPHRFLMRAGLPEPTFPAFLLFRTADPGLLSVCADRESWKIVPYFFLGLLSRRVDGDKRCCLCLCCCVCLCVYYPYYCCCKHTIFGIFWPEHKVGARCSYHVIRIIRSYDHTATPSRI